MMETKYMPTRRIDKTNLEARCPFCNRRIHIEEIRCITKIAVSTEYEVKEDCKHFLLFEPNTKVVMFGQGD